MNTNTKNEKSEKNKKSVLERILTEDVLNNAKHNEELIFARTKDSKIKCKVDDYYTAESNVVLVVIKKIKKNKVKYNIKKYILHTDMFGSLEKIEVDFKIKNIKDEHLWYVINSTTETLKKEVDCYNNDNYLRDLLNVNKETKFKKEV